MFEALDFVDGYVILCHTLLGSWLLIHAGYSSNANEMILKDEGKRGGPLRHRQRHYVCY